MALANRAYLALIADHYLDLELKRPWEELSAATGVYVGGEAPSRTRLDHVPAKSCEPVVDVLTHYFARPDQSISIQVVARDGNNGSFAVWVEGTVAP
jgi:hypothetical protein